MSRYGQLQQSSRSRDGVGISDRTPTIANTSNYSSRAYSQYSQGGGGLNSSFTSQLTDTDNLDGSERTGYSEMEGTYTQSLLNGASNNNQSNNGKSSQCYKYSNNTLDQSGRTSNSGYVSSQS